MDEAERRDSTNGEGLAAIFRRGRGRVARHRRIALSLTALLALVAAVVTGAGAASGQGGLVR
ncbi:MAG TPA: hypothetical protein VIH92_00350, partial [Solirubrobacteraceae bacterium]